MNTTKHNGRNTLLWSCTALLAMQLAASAATLTNRYSFNEADGTTAVDSVSSLNGTLVNSTLSGAGYVTLDNAWGLASSDLSGKYVDLPDDMFTNYTAVTFEIWLTPALDVSTIWARIWDFGNSSGAAAFGSTMFSRMGTSSAYVLADSWTSTLGDNWVFGQAPLVDVTENHLVWTADATTGEAKLYLNGAVIGSSYNFTISPKVSGSTTNNWLGRSNYGVDSYATMYVNEFRVYEGAVPALQVAADYQNGADTYPASYGTVTSIALTVPSPVVQGASQQATLMATASGLTSPVDVHDEAGVVYVSGNTSVATVDGNGVVSGIAPGSTTIYAQYQSVTSATQTVQVVALPTKMKYRYSFTTDASDSVGGKDGTLVNNSGLASFTGGEVILTSASDYVNLPPYLIHATNIANNAITFEGWVTCFPINGAWTRLWDFGNTAGGLGANYFFFTPNTGANGGTSRLVVSDASPGYNGENMCETGNVLGQTNVHIVGVFNPNPSRNFLGLYVNGNLVTSMTTTKEFPGINNALSYLGRSTYNGDAYLNGSINEFRIYDGELDRFQIAASYQSGADTTNFNVGTFVSLSVGAGGPTLYLDQTRVASVAINFSAATNINLLGDANLTMTSSDTNVMTVTAAGIMQARALGTATLTASFKYIVGATTNTYTGNASVTVVIPPATLVHRYSFNEGSGSVVNDLIGTAHGQVASGTNTLSLTNATWIAGQLSINTNTAIPVIDAYVSLPAGIISALVSNVTIETWATVSDGGSWARVFDFGSVPASPTNASLPNIFLSRGAGNAFPRYDWVGGNLNAAATWANATTAHFVVTHDSGDRSVKLYRDGVQIASSSTMVRMLSDINDIYCFLGRSIYSEPISLPAGYFDPYFMGSLNEVRIYRGLLTAAEIQQQSALGPDTLIANVPLTATPAGANITISWPTYGAHFALESKTDLNNSAWTPVGATVTQSGANYQVSVPMAGTAQFFRLKR